MICPRCGAQVGDSASAKLTHQEFHEWLQGLAEAATWDQKEDASRQTPEDDTENID